MSSNPASLADASLDNSRPRSGAKSGRELRRTQIPPRPYYDVDESTGCWNWNRAKMASGYGSTRYSGQYTTAHRAYYAHYVRDIPAGAVVMHDCDNPSCCNPGHLRLGDQLENMRDMVKRRRHFGPGFGAKNPTTKLTPENVVRAFELHAEGRSLVSIGKEFGVTPNSIRQVLLRLVHRAVVVPDHLVAAVRVKRCPSDRERSKEGEAA